MKRWNKIATVFLMICAAVSLTGCSASIPELSEAENDMVAEYAAGLLLKYDKNYDGALPVAGEKAVKPETLEDIPEETTEESEVPAENEDAISGDSEVSEEMASENIIVDIAAFLELEGISIDYAGYEITDSYVEGDNIAFSMDATPGNQLLVVKLNLTNTQPEDIEVDMLNKKDVRFRLIVNNGAKKNVLYTMLLDDFSIYKNTIAAGTTEQAVLICEITEEEAATVETIDLYMRNGENSVTMTLK